MEKESIGLRAWREVDAAALSENIREIRRLLGDPKIRIMAVVKANAYGHGSVETARILQKLGITDFAVAALEEGILLREQGIKGNILILGYTCPEALRKARRCDLMQTLVDEAYAEEAAKTVPGLKVHLKINTGMNRLGINWEDTKAINRILTNDRLEVQGIFSHLSMADGISPKEKAFTDLQIRRFTQLIEELEKKGICPPNRHLQSSYGILRGPLAGCNLVRPGIFLYGVHSSFAGRKTVGMEGRTFSGVPVLSIKARVAMVRSIGPGEAVSYGYDFHAKSPMRLAALTIGYGDGIPRCLKQGAVLLHGKRAPIVGRICMDQMLVDVSEIPQTAPGDTAVLLGKSKGEEIRAEEMALQAGTITNELLCRLGERMPILTGSKKEQQEGEQAQYEQKRGTGAKKSGIKSGISKNAGRKKRAIPKEAAGPKAHPGRKEATEEKAVFT